MGIPQNRVRSRGAIEQAEHEDLADARRVLNVDAEGNPISDANPLPVAATIAGAAKAKNPSIYQLPMATANTEYTFMLPSNVDQFSIIPELRKHVIKYAWTVGDSANGNKIMPGNSLEVKDLKTGTGTILYFQCEVPNTLIIEVWTI